MLFSNSKKNAKYVFLFFVSDCFNDNQVIQIYKCSYIKVLFE